MFTGTTELLRIKNLRAAANKIANQSPLTIFMCWLIGEIDHQKIVKKLRAFANGDDISPNSQSMIELLCNANGNLLEELESACADWFIKPQCKQLVAKILSYANLALLAGKNKPEVKAEMVQAKKQFSAFVKKQEIDGEIPFPLYKLISYNAKQEVVFRQPTLLALSKIKKYSQQHEPERAVAVVIDSMRHNKDITTADIKELLAQMADGFNPLISVLALLLDSDKSNIAREIEYDIQRAVAEYHEYMQQQRILYFAETLTKPRQILPILEPKSTAYAQEIIQRALKQKHTIAQLNCTNESQYLDVAKMILKAAKKAYQCQIC